MLDRLANSPLFRTVGTWLVLSGVMGFFAMRSTRTDRSMASGVSGRKDLFIIALAGGSFGMALGSELFHHKSRSSGRRRC